MSMVVTEVDGLASRVALSGRLDTAGVDVIETRFNAAVVAAGRPVLVDMSSVSFVSSMGLRLLFTAAKAARSRDQRLLLLVPSGPVREVLETAAVDTLIPMFADGDEALKHLVR
jgi:anti-sigma B factor antagonist